MSKRSVELELKSRVRVKEEWNESDSRVEIRAEEEWSVVYCVII